MEMNSDCNREFEDELAAEATTQPTTGGAPQHTHIHVRGGPNLMVFIPDE